MSIGSFSLLDLCACPDPCPACCTCDASSPGYNSCCNNCLPTIYATFSDPSGCFFDGVVVTLTRGVMAGSWIGSGIANDSKTVDVELVCAACGDLTTLTLTITKQPTCYILTASGFLSNGVVSCSCAPFQIVWNVSTGLAALGPCGCPDYSPFSVTFTE